MKKLFTILLAVTMLASMATVASAAGTTTLTTTVPAASYTLNIPADQEIPFGATSTEIGEVTVTNSSGFARGKNLNVTFDYVPFSCENVSTTIPFVINMYGMQTTGGNAGNSFNLDYESGEFVVFKGKADGTVANRPTKTAADTSEFTAMNIVMNSTDWGKALAGEYTATITFTAEVVVN